MLTLTLSRDVCFVFFMSFVVKRIRNANNGMQTGARTSRR